MNELPTSYNIFWREFRSALQVAGVSAAQYLKILKRLKAIEGEDKGPGMGQTGYLNGIDPWEAISEVILYLRGERAEPEWLIHAEKGQ